MICWPVRSPRLTRYALYLLLAACAGCSTPEKREARLREKTFTAEFSAPAKPRLRLAIKDNIDLEGTITTAGSKYLAKNGTPAVKDAACLRIARARGVTIVGKTNMSELSVGTTGMNDYFGTPFSPLDPRHKFVPGGSSSGSGVAVAAGFADVAFGTDTAGSIRVPAACSGVYGLKTTFGMVSMKGIFPMSPKYLDVVGPMARDTAHLAEGMALLQENFPSLYAAARASAPIARSLKVGRLYIPGTDPDVDRAIDEALERTGFRVVKLPGSFLEQWKRAEKNGEKIMVMDAGQTTKDFQNKPGVTARTKSVLAVATVESQAAYVEAIREREAWQRTLRQTFRNVDLIALPTLREMPPRIPLFERSALFEARMLALQNTVAVNYAGNPAISIPVPVEDEPLPVTSLQLIAPPRQEARLLNAARLIEKHHEKSNPSARRLAAR